jgi:hypothetical protein
LRRHQKQNNVYGLESNADVLRKSVYGIHSIKIAKLLLPGEKVTKGMKIGNEVA